MQSANENYTLIRSVYLSINIYLTFITSYIKIDKKTQRNPPKYVKQEK